MILRIMDKKKYLLIGIAVVIIIALMATMCGGGDNEEANEAKEGIKPIQTEVKGDLKDYFEVVDKNCKLKPNKYLSSIVVELRRIGGELPFSITDVEAFNTNNEPTADYYAGFGIELLNADGEIIAKQPATMFPYSENEIMEALRLQPGETTTIEINIEATEKDFKNAVNYRITSALQDNRKKREELKNNSGKSDSNSDDIDKTLEQTEKALELAGKILGN